jgi:hypothetical protein
MPENRDAIAIPHAVNLFNVYALTPSSATRTSQKLGGVQ